MRRGRSVRSTRPRCRRRSTRSRRRARRWTVQRVLAHRQARLDADIATPRWSGRPPQPGSRSPSRCRTGSTSPLRAEGVVEPAVRPRARSSSSLARRVEAGRVVVRRVERLRRGRLRPRSRSWSAFTVATSSSSSPGRREPAPRRRPRACRALRRSASAGPARGRPGSRREPGSGPGMKGPVGC